MSVNLKRLMSFKFLKETPQTEDTGLDFGHKEIVSTLKNIICNEDQNLTIGLFGSWGTGKSSIVETLKNRLKETKIPLVLFDVWKHEGDALRRTFLIELTAKLETDYGKEYFKEGYSLNKRVTSSQNTSKEVLSFKKEKLKLHMTLLLILGSVFFAILLIVGRFFAWVEVDIFEGLRAKELIIAAMGTLSLTVLYKYIDYFIKAEKTEVKEERFQDPHEFEWEFSNIIENLCGEAGKIVITFDNLDRISGDNALKIISTIKTFLDYRSKDDENKKTVFFLIPCDVNSMKAHISFSSISADRGDQKEQYWEEFLRKFFNTSIWIPEFYPTELEKFAIAKLTEVEVPEFKNDYLSWLIIKVFNKNPRQIIQFINILLSNYLLLKEFCENGAFHDKNFYKENIPQLAKFLLIKQRHSICLEEYSTSGIYELSNEALLEKITDENFKNLLKQTEDIYIPSLEPYFKYRMSRSEQENEKIVRFITAVTSGSENLEEELKQIDFKKDSIAFNSIVRSKLQGINNLLLKSDLIKQVLQLSARDKLKLDVALFKELTLFISNLSDWRIPYRIAPMTVLRGLIKKAPNITIAERNAIVNNYFDTLARHDHIVNFYSPEKLTEQSSEVFRFAVAYDKKLGQQQISKVSDFLEDNLENPYIMDNFLKKEKSQQEFITEKFRDNLIESFKPDRGIEASLRCLKMIVLLLPKQTYYYRAVEVLNANFEVVFSDSNLTSHSAVTFEFVGLLAEILTYLASAEEHPSTENQLAPLMNKTVTFLVDQPITSDVVNYISLLDSLALYDSSRTRALDMIKEMLVYDNAEFIKTILENFHSIFSSNYGMKVEEALLDNLAKFIELEEFIPLLSLEQSALLTAKLVENGRYELAEKQLTEFRDQWKEETRKELADQLKSSLRGAIASPGPKEELKALIELILFSVDLERDELQRLEFWTIITDMLLSAEPSVKELAYRKLTENINLIKNEDAEVILRWLLARVNSYGLYNDYIFHETIFQLFVHFQNLVVSLDYLGYIFRDFIRLTTTTDVCNVCAHAIEDMPYEVNIYLSEISTFLDQCGSIDHTRLGNQKIILKALEERLKGNRSAQFKEIRERIRSLK